jgi:hypothetical protein
MKKIVCWVLFVVPLFIPVRASACTIPVFRYALEKWDLTPYEIMIYHRGPLTADVQKEIKKWDAPNKSNVEITLIDLDGDMTPRQQKIWKSDGDPARMPWMVVRYAPAAPSEPSAFAGPCTIASLHGVLDSPVRRALLAHLTRGAATVYVLMTSDDPAADRAALEMATRELQALERKIKLPVQSDEGPKIKLPLPLKVSFPILVLDRRQPEEAAFVQMLLSTEDRLLQTKGPILFPIFGRGRVLGGLTDKEINPEQLKEVSKFLCRECSCQVKELNPGIDVLLVGDWNAIFDAMYEGKEPVPMPPMSAVYFSAFAKSAPVIEAPSKKSTTTSQEKPAPADTSIAVNVQTPPPPAPAMERPADHQVPVRFALWIGIGIASGLVLLTGGWVVVQWKN